LPTHLEDPLERLRAVHESMRAAKELHAAIPAALLSDPSLFSVPAVSAQAARLSAELQLHEHTNLSNLYISNVPGPKGPLYYGGSEMLATYPLSAINEGLGLNITINGYGDGLGIGLLADRELVPKLDELATYIVDELEILRKSV
jgi:diacylglycerol O-acyltransferase / wax synthase